MSEELCLRVYANACADTSKCERFVDIHKASSHLPDGALVKNTRPEVELRDFAAEALVALKPSPEGILLLTCRNKKASVNPPNIPHTHDPQYPHDDSSSPMIYAPLPTSDSDVIGNAPLSVISPSR